MATAFRSRFLSCCVAGVLVSAAAQADVTMQEQMNLSGAGMMKMANMNGTTTTTISGNKARTESTMQFESGLMRTFARGSADRAATRGPSGRRREPGCAREILRGRASVARTENSPNRRGQMIVELVTFKTPEGWGRERVAWGVGSWFIFGDVNFLRFVDVKFLGIFPNLVGYAVGIKPLVFN